MSIEVKQLQLNTRIDSDKDTGPKRNRARKRPPALLSAGQIGQIVELCRIEFDHCRNEIRER